MEERMAERVNRRKVRVGVVVGDKMDKTVVVRVTREFRHPVYGKRVKLSKKYMAHDENNECQVGDVVRIMETRPLSRHKRWRVVEIIEKAKKLGETVESAEE
jgi:small subunit ribosomal protein S17